MRYSQAFIPTVKEVPKEATMPSHVLMLRAGYARMVGAGIYELLPLGTRVLHKIERIASCFETVFIIGDHGPACVGRDDLGGKEVFSGEGRFAGSGDADQRDQ